jgi:hypothetical protein
MVMSLIGYGAFTPAAGGGGALLLDSLAATPLAAFSTRKLRSAYAGSAIRVRRSSDNTEQDIGFSGDDLDTAALASFVGSDSAYVKTWYDQSTNATNAGSISNGKQPRVVNAGTNETLNGKVAPLFTNASTQNLQATLASAIGSGSHSLATASQRTSYWGTHVTIGASGTDNKTSALGSDSNNSNAWYGGWGLGNSYRGSATLTGDPRSLIKVYNATTIEGYVSNTSDASLSYSLFNIDNAICHIGSFADVTYFFGGTISEVLIFASAISSGDRGLINTSHQSYWGTP